MLNVLLVNKNQEDLAQLERSLFPMRGQWTLSHAHTGRDVLKKMSNETVDAIITSYGLSDTNGIVLLEEIAKDQEDLIGILRADCYENFNDLTRKNPRHVVFDRVCEAKSLINIIELLVDLRKLLKNEKLVSVLSELTHVPTPDLDEEVCLADLLVHPLAEKIKQDILEFTCSVYQASSLKKATFEQTVHLMEPTVLRGLVLRTVVYDFLSHHIDDAAFLQKEFSHSLAVGTFARRLALEENMPRSIMNEAIVAGLLHNVGNLLLAANHWGTYQKVMSRAKAENVSYVPLQEKAFGVSHAEIGAYFLSQWGMKDTIVAATAYHLNPTLSPCADVGALLAVHVANALVMASHEKAEKYAALFMLNRQYIKAAGVSSRMPIWEQMFTQIV